MTLEQRVTNLEEAMITMADTTRQQGEALTESVVKLVDVVSAQQEMLVEHRQELAEHRQELAEHRQEVAEFRRESAMMQRLWVHLARKNGWMDEDDWPPPEQP